MEESEIKPIRKEKMRKWLDSEVDILLKSWKSNFHLKRLANPKRKSLFYNAIRRDLQKHDYERPVNEIMAKTHVLMKSYRNKKKSIVKNGKVGNFPFFFDLIDIEKLELQNESESEMDPPILSNEKDGEEIIEDRNNPQDAQATKNNLPSSSCDFDSASQTCSRNNQPKTKESNEDAYKEGSNPHPPSKGLPISTEDILLSFSRSFKKINSQLKKNDARLMELLREQNEIYKTQSALLRKFISQD